MYFWSTLLKVIRNEKQEGMGRWQTFAIGLGPKSSRFNFAVVFYFNVFPFRPENEKYN
jgi:hypothetical protein